jgi:diacylglycerol kinase (ATP)
MLNRPAATGQQWMVATIWRSHDMTDLNMPRDSQRFTLHGRVKSFSYALQGIRFMLKTQHNAWLHAVATVTVIVLALYFNVSAIDWRWLITAIAMVWVAETINTALEYVCDVVSPNFHLSVKHAKDIAAGGVLISAIAAVVIGVSTFWPYFLKATG